MLGKVRICLFLQSLIKSTSFYVLDERDKSVAPVTRAAQAVPEYKATPKLLALPLPGLPLPSAVKKKTINLEYQPEKPAINASPSKKRSSFDSAPVYIPASTVQRQISTNENSPESDAFDLDACNDELNELSGIIEEDNVLEDDIEEPKFSNDEDESKDSIKKEIKKEPLGEEVVKVKEESIESSSKRLNTTIEKHKRRDSSSSSNSHNRHKHHKSKSKESKESEKVKKEEDKRKDHESKHHEKEKRKGGKLSSSSISKHKSSSSSSRKSSRDKESKESKLKDSSSLDKKHHSSSSSSKLKSSSSLSKSSASTTSISKHSSSSSSSSSERKSSKESSSTSIKTEKNDFVAEELFATTEEDIMKECEMIYDQLEQEFASLHQGTEVESEKVKKEAEAEETKNKLKRKLLDEEELQNATSKKRVAYENAQKHKSLTPAVVHKPDHRKNAMQVNIKKMKLSTTLRRLIQIIVTQSCIF